MKKHKKRWMALALVLVLAAAGIAIAYSMMHKAPDLGQGGWIQGRMEALAPLYQCDFVLNEAYVYTGEEGKLTVSYATRAGIPEIRAHFDGLMDDAAETGANDEGNLHLEGALHGRAFTVRNYFSEVTNIIEMTLEEPDAALRKAVAQAFPEQAFAAHEEFRAVLGGASDSGYVLYNYDAYDQRLAAEVPVYSRAYAVAEPVESVEIGDAGALLSMAPHQVEGTPVAVLLYQAKPTEEGE